MSLRPVSSDPVQRRLDLAKAREAKSAHLQVVRELVGADGRTSDDDPRVRAAAIGARWGLDITEMRDLIARNHLTDDAMNRAAQRIVDNRPPEPPSAA
jgi:hypothetical protein